MKEETNRGEIIAAIIGTIIGAVLGSMISVSYWNKMESLKEENENLKEIIWKRESYFESLYNQK